MKSTLRINCSATVLYRSVEDVLKDVRNQCHSLATEQDNPWLPCVFKEDFLTIAELIFQKWTDCMVKPLDLLCPQENRNWF